MDIDYAIEKLNKRSAEYRLNELLLISASRYKKQPNLDSLYEAESLEQVARWLEELKEARGKLKAIEDIAREILNRPNTENTRVNLKRALTDILDISKSGEEV